MTRAVSYSLRLIVSDPFRDDAQSGHSSPSSRPVPSQARQTFSPEPVAPAGTAAGFSSRSMIASVGGTGKVVTPTGGA